MLYIKTKNLTKKYRFYAAWRIFLGVPCVKLPGRSLQEGMRLAAMASAIGVTRAGAAASIPFLEEVEKALYKLEKM